MESNVPIAVIGMSCRFPGNVNSPEELWDLLADGRSGWSEIPTSRFYQNGVYHPNSSKVNTMNVKGGHFLTEDVSRFDAAFFQLSSETASALDPQFRMQLESTYEALESAGISLQQVAGTNTSVFAGAFFRDYSDAQMKDPETMSRFLLVGVGSAMAANRISHFYDLRGPSMTIDTGCSTTLTALHQACQNLRTRESDMSIVGGANVMLNPEMFITMSSLALLSPDGKSYTFDSRANGYGRGEGSATIIIKRLDDALRDGDPIRGIIRASAANQDGKTETITSPSQKGQEELIRACYKQAGLDPSETTYFEAHGTGTPTGDPIEVGAIAAVFKDKRPVGEPLRIGSVKTNIGHTETPSGLASIIKVVLAAEKGQIPPSINFKQPNAKLHLEDWNLKVPTELEVWQNSTGIRRASVNNFGYGGSNAHAIVESFESYMASQKEKKKITNGTTNGANSHGETNGITSITNSINGITNGTNGVTNGTNGYHSSPNARIIFLSGRDEQATQAMVSNLKDYVSKATIEDEDKFLDDLAYTLCERRSIFPWIITATFSSLAELASTLGSGKLKPARRSDPPRLGYVFTGQGAQWFGMGRELIDAYPTFKATLAEAESYLKKLGANWSLIEELQKDEQSSRVNEVALSTAMCVAVQIALVRLLSSWGINPVAVTSHSSGEVASACAAGAITLERAMAIVYFRGELAGDLGLYITGKGGMVAVGLGTKDVAKYLSRVTAGKAGVACINSPNSVTISGDVPAVEELEGFLKEDKVFARRLKINAAYHSHHMEALGKPYLSFLSQYSQPEDSVLDVIYSSPTTGTRISSAKQLNDPNHWVRSLTQPVQFEDAFRSMCFEDLDESSKGNIDPAVDIAIELGPHAALSGPIQEIVSMLPDFASTGGKPTYMTGLVRHQSALTTIHTLASNLLRSGYAVDMKAVNFPRGRNQDKIRVLHDLPRYPWNHQTRHWTESKANLSLRQRQTPPHDLLGSLALNTNILAPTWRHHIRVGDMPWVRDHIVQGNIVYPGAGYLIMAIEGALEMFRLQASSHETQGGGQKKQQRILGYQLRDVDILQALVVPETLDGVEVQLALSPCTSKALYETGWLQFTVSSVSVSAENVVRWSEHCKGLIMVEAADENDTTRESSQLSLDVPGIPSKVGEMTKDYYRLRIEPQDIYAGMRSGGICHGPIFQNLKTIRAREEESVSNFVVADTSAAMPKGSQQPHVIHPTTLDSIFQAAYTALPGAGSKATAPQIPRSINRLWVANNIRSNAGHRFNAFSKMNRADLQSFDASIVVVDDNSDGQSPTNTPVLTMSGFVCQSIGNNTQQRDTNANENYGMSKWVPDISMLNPALLKKQLSYPIDPTEEEVIVDLKRLCYYFMADSISALSADDVQQLEWHHKKFYVWMKLQIELANENKLGPNSSEWKNSSIEERAALIEKASAASVNGEMVCRLGPEILRMLRREITPLEVMMEDKLLWRYYQTALKYDRSSQQIGKLVEHFVRKNPRGKILEIGGGTGGTSTHILGAVGRDDSDLGPQASSYDFTDISSGFFEAAKEKLSDWQSLVRYKKLDIEEDATKQGFEEGTYDLIVACQVLHATKSMKRTMSNVRKLLKPGGKLLLLETTQDHVDLQFVFGLLPGWWLSEEEERKFSPSLSIDMWDNVLKDTGFNGVELEVHDCDNDELYSFSMMTSTAIDKKTNYTSEVTIITESPAPPTAWLEELQASIAKVTGRTPAVQELGSTEVDDDKVYVFVGEVSKPILENPSLAQFDAIKALCTKAKGILWVTRGGAVECSDVHSSLAPGFLRTLRREYGEKRLVSLDIDPSQELWSAASVAPIAEVFAKQFNYSSNPAIKDFEFAARDGAISIPRYYKDVERNSEIIADPAEIVPEPGPFHEPGRPLQMIIRTPGLLDTLAFRDDPYSHLDLEANGIEVEPKAFAVNFRDVLVAMGHLSTRIMGFECAGLITRVSPEAAENGYKPGDRVAMFLRGHYGSLVRAPWTSAVHIPDDLSFEVATSLPMSFATAHHALYDQARLQKGETILIHAGTGAFGQAAIMLAKHIGAEIFVTVGTQAKREFITKTYGIQPDHIFNSRDKSFAAGVLAATGGNGVDVVLNSLAGVLLQESFNCIARFGRFIEIGKRDLEQNNFLELGSFARVASFNSIDLLEAIKYKPHKLHQTLKDVMSLFQSKVISAVDPLTVYPVSEIGKAFRFMQAGKHMGKLIISTTPEDIVPVLPRVPSANLRSDATYLIVGGLGGIGRSVCHWMATNGARHVIVLSRSANSQEKAASFLADMKRIGCQVKMFGCDVSNELALAEVLKTAALDMPPIAGVVQAAMVLQDSILELMTIEDWLAAVRPKVHGSWNLHTQLSKTGLDFFVMLSSLAGICGYASQANYSAGGSFEDALAVHRTASGLPGVAIDIGIVKSVGYVAETDGTAERLIVNSGYMTLSEDDVLGAIESAIIRPHSGQILLGLSEGSNRPWEDTQIARDLRFSSLRYQNLAENSGVATKAGSNDLSSRIAAATTFDEAVGICSQGITRKLMDIFMIEEADLDPASSLSSYGVDSLVAVELRNMLSLRAGADISIFDIMQSATITTLAVTVASKSSYLDASLAST